MAPISYKREATEGLVSVVIPAYKSDRFIGDALASIGRQTYRNWEVIVVEDGSQGETERIVRSFARRHPWHRVEYSRNEQNCGPSHTRNVAFSKVRGEFVALLDADDSWFQDHLTVSTDALKSSGRDIAYSTVVVIEDQSDMLLCVWGPEARDLAEFPLSLFRRNFVNPSATVLRRQVLADVGTWNTNLRYCEDLDFWLRCIIAGKTFQYLGGCHCLYRRNHAEAATGKMCLVLESYADVIEGYRPFPGIEDRTSRRFIADAFVTAAQRHAISDPRYDSSADRSRAAYLMMKAWKLKRNRVRYLWQAAKYVAADLLRGRKRKVEVQEPIEIALPVASDASPTKLAA